MNIGDAQVGIVFATHLFDELFKAFYREGLFPRRSDSTVDTPGGPQAARVLLDVPTFEAVATGDEAYTRLRLTGHVELRPLDHPDAPPILDVPLDTSVRLSVALFEVEGAAPVLGMTYDGVDEPPDLPLTAEMVDQVFTTDPVASLLSNLEIDVVAPVIAALSDLSFPDGDAPGADEWDADIALMSERGDNWASICIYVGQPDTLDDLGDDESFMPRLTEFGIVYSRTFMDEVLDLTASEQEGTDLQGATLTRLSLAMEDEALRVDGEAERDGGVVTFMGPIHLALIRGSDVFAVDTSGVEVNVDLPWFVDVLLFITSPAGSALTFGLGFLIGEVIRVAAGTNLAEVNAQVDAVPGLVRGGMAQAISGGLAALAAGLEIDGDVSGVRALSTIDHSVIEDGHILLLAQVFMNPFSSRISGGTYSKRARRFVQFELAGGRRLASTELVRFIDEGMIFTPGYHTVHHENGHYLRGNPDERLRNNLEERFGG